MEYQLKGVPLHRFYGKALARLAQLVEQLTLNQWVQGSNPCQDTTLRGVAQLASAPRSGRGGRKFESSHPDTANRKPPLWLSW